MFASFLMLLMNSGYCGNGVLGSQSNGVCGVVSACGAVGQRACCVGESTDACQSGLVELTQPNSGYCRNGVLGSQSDGVCGVVSACGGQGERACCALEAAFGAWEAATAEVEALG